MPYGMVPDKLADGVRKQHQGVEKTLADSERKQHQGVPDELAQNARKKFQGVEVLSVEEQLDTQE